MAIEDDVQRIRKEIVESHNLIIKTDNLVKNLSAEIRQIYKKQEKYERKYILNSAVAYILFVVVMFGSLYVAFDAKVGVVRREKQSLEEELQKVKTERDELQGKLSVRAQQEKATEHFLRLKQQNQDLDALKVLEDLDLELLPPMLKSSVSLEADSLRQKLGGIALEAGRTLYKNGQLKRALREFDRALKVKPPAELLAKIHYQRAQTLLKLNQNAQAAESFLAAADAHPQSSFAGEALFAAGTCLETTGDMPQALLVFQRLVQKYANSTPAAQARHRVAKLTRSGPAGVQGAEPHPGGGGQPEKKPPASTPEENKPAAPSPVPSEAGD